MGLVESRTGASSSGETSLALRALPASVQRQLLAQLAKAFPASFNASTNTVERLTPDDVTKLATLSTVRALGLGGFVHSTMIFDSKVKLDPAGYKRLAFELGKQSVADVSALYRNEATSAFDQLTSRQGPDEAAFRESFALGQKTAPPPSAAVGAAPSAVVSSGAGAAKAASPSVIAMARALRAELTADAATAWLKANPSLSKALRAFEAPARASSTEIKAQAERALRHLIASGAGVPVDLPVGRDVRAMAAAYARDLGFKDVAIVGGQAFVEKVGGGQRIALGKLDPSATPVEQLEALGKALNLARFDLAVVEPPPLKVSSATRSFEVPTSHLMSHLGMLAYADKATVEAQLSVWGYDMKKFSWVESPETETQAFVVADKQGNSFCVFRGTAEGKDFGTDGKISFVKPSWTKSKNGAQIHAGFSQALDSVWPQIKTAMVKATGGDPKASTFFGGHSLGAALGQLAAKRAVDTGLSASGSVQVYTIGSPRIGNEAFRESYNATMPRSFRAANFEEGRFASVQDLVTMIAPMSLGYRAVGNLVRLGAGGGVEVISVNDLRARAVPPAGVEKPQAAGVANLEELPADPTRADIENMRGEELERFMKSLTRTDEPTIAEEGVNDTSTSKDVPPAGALGERSALPAAAAKLSLPSVSFHKSSTYVARTGAALRALD